MYQFLVVGINIGVNRDSTDRVADYVALADAFAPVASYLTVNVSSPNTPGLRDLQHAKALDDLLARVMAVRDRANRVVPVLVKIAPDLTLADLDEVVGVMLAETYVRVEGAFPLIGVGGIDSGAAAFAKIKAGATLVQLYTGLVFRGLRLVSDIKTDLANFVRLGRYHSLADAVGLDAAAMTAEPWPE